jgi:hypothetical protein
MARMPEPVPEIEDAVTGLQVLLERQQGHARRWMLAGAKSHARVERDDRFPGSGAILSPARPYDYSPDALDVEVLLPGVRPVLFMMRPRAQSAAARRRRATTRA